MNKFVLNKSIFRVSKKHFSSLKPFVIASGVMFLFRAKEGF